MKKRWLAAVFFLLGLSSNAYAHGVNYGFEAGDTSGWAETYPDFGGKIDVVNGWTSHGTTYSPVEGGYFAVLETGGPDGKYVTLSQKIALNGGDRLEGAAGFCCGDEVGFPYAGDNMNYNDYAQISVLNGYGNVIAIPWYADSIDIGYGVTTPDNQWTGEYVYFGPVQWQDWGWTAPEQGSYTLQFQTTQDGDSERLSYAFFDGPRSAGTGGTLNSVQPVNSSVPEPSSMVLLGLAVAGVIAAHRFSRPVVGSSLA